MQVVTNLGASSSGYTWTTRIKQKLGVKCLKVILQNFGFKSPNRFGSAKLFSKKEHWLGEFEL